MRWPWRDHDRDQRAEEIAVRVEHHLEETRAQSRKVDEVVRVARQMARETSRQSEELASRLRRAMMGPA